MDNHITLCNKCIRHGLRITIFGLVFGAIFFLALSASSGLLVAEENPDSATVPPLANFYTAIVPATVLPGQKVTYEITISNQDPTYKEVMLGVTSTLPAGVTAIPGTVTVVQGGGEATISASGDVTWTGWIEQPVRIVIAYQAQVSSDACGQKTSQAQLYEIANNGAGGPTEKRLEWLQSFSVGSCKAYLPSVKKSLAPIPLLDNWHFEGGPTATGWGQYDNEQASTLIYSTDKKSISMPHGGKWFGWLGGVLNMTSELRQKIPLPGGHSGIKLRFLYFIESADDCGQDNGYVLLDGEQIGNPYQLCKTTATGAWKQAEIPVDAKYLDRELMLTLRSKTSALKNSNWLIDNVQFCSTDPQAAAQDRCQ